MGDLNALYERYLSNGELEPLITSVRNKAMLYLHDDDSAQALAVGVWEALPSLVIKTSFSAWFHTRLRWHIIDGVRKRLRSREDATEGDALELNAFVYASREPYLADFCTDEITETSILRIAELLADGLTQAEAAAYIGIRPSALRKRLERYRARSK